MWAGLYPKHLEVHDILQFPFMDPPSKDALVQSLETLLALGAVDADLRITPRGGCGRGRGDGSTHDPRPFAYDALQTPFWQGLVCH